jgi:dihydropteroate synthase
MHTRGRPEDWKTLPALAPDEVVPLVKDELARRLEQASGSIAAERIVIDPGFGFGKRLDENYPLLAHLDELLTLGRPLLAGVSRKGFLGPSVPANARGSASLAALTIAILNGASLVRVHDVRASVEAANIADAVLAPKRA